jgi:Uma2 family endonuclease
MGMPDLAPKWTRQMVQALPDDGNRYELFGGELLVTPAPSGLHQMALRVLYDAIAPYVTAQGVGAMFWSPADLALGGEELSQPDLFVVSTIPPDRDWSAFPDPTLVIEVLSPSTARFDRFTKRRRFQRASIPEYWIVDLDARSVDRWRPTDERPETLDTQLVWHPDGASLPLELDLTALFTAVWGTPGPHGAE